MPQTPDELSDESFVSLTTYRRDGTAVPTTVWVARDGDALVVTTPAGSGKVKRLRRNPSVTLRPSSRRGAVADGAPVSTGQAGILDDAASVERLGRLFRAKYGLEYRVMSTVEKIVTRGKGTRVILRITLTP